MNEGVVMASGLSSILVLVPYVILSPCVFGDNCLPYGGEGFKNCEDQFCCGDCYNRYCCSLPWRRFDDDKQAECYNNIHTYSFASSTLPIICGVVGFIVIAVIIICCCCCPCCCVYKMYHKPQTVIATHTTVVSTTPQQYPEQPTAVPGLSQSYQGMPNESVPAKPFYPALPGYPAQHIYPAQPTPTSPYHVQPFTPGPPPSYQEATNPAYPPQLVPYSQAAFIPGQPTYPLMPPAEPQPTAPPTSTDVQAQPPFNPDFVAPQP